MSTNTTVTELLDPIWTEVVAEHLKMYPTSVALVIEPEILGRYMAETGAPCEPRRYYRKPADVEAYTAAYNGTAALWAQMVDAKNAELDALDAAHLADTEDYEEDILDREFWRLGQF